MKARLVARDVIAVGDGEVAHVLIWEVPIPVAGSAHSYKYILAFVCDDICVVRFDNERGKGDHVHIKDQEARYEFHDLDRLEDDFWRTVREWRVQNDRFQHQDD